MRGQEVIGIQEKDELPFRQFQSAVPGGSHPLVFRIHHRDYPLVRGAEFVHDGQGAVRGAVFHHQAFPVRKGLVHYAS